MAKARGRKPSATLFNEDGPYCLDEFHDIFIECEDMTEYTAAIKLVGSWKEWCRIKNDWPAFVGYIEEWKEELEILLRSRATAKIQSLLEDSESDSVKMQAAKYLSEAGWKKRAGAGRPSKREKERELKAMAQSAAETKDEETRILKLVNGGDKK